MECGDGDVGVVGVSQWTDTSSGEGRTSTTGQQQTIMRAQKGGEHTAGSTVVSLSTLSSLAISS